MKAREIKKKLLNNYESAIEDYRVLIGEQEKKRISAQARIRVIEQQLFEIFNIEKRFNFDYLVNER